MIIIRTLERETFDSEFKAELISFDLCIEKRYSFEIFEGANLVSLSSNLKTTHRKNTTGNLRFRSIVGPDRFATRCKLIVDIFILVATFRDKIRAERMGERREAASYPASSFSSPRLDSIS